MPLYDRSSQPGGHEGHTREPVVAQAKDVSERRRREVADNGPRRSHRWRRHANDPTGGCRLRRAPARFSSTRSRRQPHRLSSRRSPALLRIPSVVSAPTRGALLIGPGVIVACAHADDKSPHESWWVSVLVRLPRWGSTAVGQRRPPVGLCAGRWSGSRSSPLVHVSPRPVSAPGGPERTTPFRSPTSANGPVVCYPP